MSTTYYSNIFYEEFLSDTKDIEIREPKELKYILPHKQLYLNGNYIWVFKENEGQFKTTASFERTGSNNPTEIFNLILKQFKDSVILEEHSLIPWPACGGYSDSCNNASQ